MKKIFSDGFHAALRKIKLIFKDHSRLLFKSSADNHLHLQKCREDSSGKIVCSMSFSSYSDLKSYQKKLRTVTVSLSSAVAMVLIAVIVSPLIFNAISIDAAGNEARSTDFVLLTPKRKENIIQIIGNNFQDIFGWAQR